MAILLNSSVRRAVAGGRGLDNGVVTSRPAVKTERGGGVSERLWGERERGGSGLGLEGGAPGSCRPGSPAGWPPRRRPVPWRASALPTTPSVNNRGGGDVGSGLAWPAGPWPRGGGFPFLLFYFRFCLFFMLPCLF